MFHGAVLGAHVGQHALCRCVLGEATRWVPWGSCSAVGLCSSRFSFRPIGPFWYLAYDIAMIFYKNKTLSILLESLPPCPHPPTKISQVSRSLQQVSCGGEACKLKCGSLIRAVYNHLRWTQRRGQACAFFCYKTLLILTCWSSLRSTLCIHGMCVLSAWWRTQPL